VFSRVRGFLCDFDDGAKGATQNLHFVPLHAFLNSWIRRYTSSRKRLGDEGYLWVELPTNYPALLLLLRWKRAHLKRSRLYVDRNPMVRWSWRRDTMGTEASRGRAGFI
jgi:hypothetical protein